MIDVTDTPHGLHLDTDGGTPVTLSPDTVAAIVQHELGKLGLWWAEEQRALVLTAPAADGYIVLLLDGVASGAHWTAVGAKASTPLDRRLGDAVAAYLATLPAEPELPKPGEVWRITLEDGSEYNALVGVAVTGAPVWRTEGGGVHLGTCPPDRRRLLVEADGTVVSDE